jgi:hypothetical protein
MRGWLGLFIALTLMAQERPPLETVRGEVLERSGDEKKGDFSIRLENNRVYWCLYDGGTRIEGTSGQLSPGDRVAMKAEMSADNSLCYAREISVAVRVPSALEEEVRQLLRKKPGTLGSVLFPRGNLTFAGVVLKVTPDRLTVQTRQSGREVFILRADTDFTTGGVAADRSACTVNMRIFIRAGRSFQNELEAFQVVWGEIVQPREASR